MSDLLDLDKSIVFLNNKEVIGNLLKKVKKAGEYECYTECKENSNCTAFTFDNSEKECSLKGSNYSITPSSTGISYIFEDRKGTEIEPVLQKAEKTAKDTDTPAEKANKSCTDAVNNVLVQTENNRVLSAYNGLQDKKHASRDEKYKKDWNEAFNAYYNWKKKEGPFQYITDYMKEKENEIILGRECISTVDGKKHDDYCVNDVGLGWYDTGAIQSNCTLGMGRVSCKRSEAAWEDWLKNKEKYYDKEPMDPSKVVAPVRSDLPTKELVKFDQIVQCCGNTINLSGNVTAKDINQDCDAAATVIKDTAKKIVAYGDITNTTLSPAVTAPEVKKPVAVEDPKKTLLESLFTGDNLIYSIFVIVSIVLCFSMISAIFGIFILK